MRRRGNGKGGSKYKWNIGGSWRRYCTAHGSQEKISGEKMKENPDQWKLAGALYISKGITYPLWLIGIFPIAAGAVLASATLGDNHAMYTNEIILGRILIAAGILLTAFMLRRNSVEKRKMYFAVFRDHIILFPTKGPSKVRDYVRIPYRNITGYTLEEYIYSDDDTGRLHYTNYGKLDIMVGQIEYRTKIDDIKQARSWMEKFAPVKETMQKRY